MSSNVKDQPSLSECLGELIDLLVDHRVKLNALEHVPKQTNPPVHEFCLSEIAYLKDQDKSRRFGLFGFSAVRRENDTL